MYIMFHNLELFKEDLDLKQKQNNTNKKTKTKQWQFNIHKAKKKKNYCVALTHPVVNFENVRPAFLFIFKHFLYTLFSNFSYLLVFPP